MARLTTGGGTSSSHKRKVVPPEARYYQSQARQLKTEASRQRHAAQRPRPGATVPLVGNVVTIPQRAPRVARAQRQTRQIEKAVRQRARYGASVYSGGGPEDLLAQAMRSQRNFERRMQRRGFGAAASYYRRHPGAGSSHSLYARPGTLSGGTLGLNADRRYTQAQAIRALGGISADDRARYANLFRLIGASPTSQIAADVRARRFIPAKKVLDQLDRTLRFSGGAIHGLKQGDLGEAAKLAGKGFLLQGERYTPGQEIVGEGGGTFGSLARFGVDVLGDPATWFTGGTATLAGRTAIKVGERTAVRAYEAKLSSLAPRVAAGDLSKRQAKALARESGRTRGRQAAERYLDEAPPEDLRRGLTIGFTGGATARRAGRAVTRKVAPNLERRIARRKGERGRLGPHRRAAAPLTRITAGTRRSRAGQSTLAKFLRNTGASAHAGVRPAGATAREFQIEKQIGAQGRAREDVAVEQANQTVRALLRSLDPEDAVRVMDAYEARNLSSLPSHLRDVGRTIRSHMRYVRRQERRGSVLAGDIGPSAKSRREIELGPKAERQIRNKDFARANRSVERAQQNLEYLQQRYWRLREQDPTSSNPRHPAREKLAKQVQVARQQVERAKNFREELRLVDVADRQAAKKEVEQIRATRLREEAREYLPREPEEEIFQQAHVVKRIAEGEMASSRKGMRGSKERPESGASQFREYRKTRKGLREGTATERAVEAQFSKRLPETIQLRSAKGGRALRGSLVNRELANKLGKPLPHADEIDGELLRKMREEPDGGRAIYRLEGSDLVELKPHDFLEAKRGAMSAKARAAADQKQRAYLKREGFTTEEIDKMIPQRSARYVVLPRRQVDRVRSFEEGSKLELGAVGDAYDSAARTFKTLALATVQYLVRNHGGDMFNAWTDENVFRLLRNAYGPSRSQRVLSATGKRGAAYREKDVAKRQEMLQDLNRLEQAGNTFERLLKPGARDVQLTPEQAREIAGPSGQRLYNMVRADYAAQIRKEMPGLTSKQVKQEMVKRGFTPDKIREDIEKRLLSGRMSPLHVGQIAEQYGVIGQGRFAEAMDMGRTPLTKRSGRWQRIVKRVEDSTRLTTFMGGLQRHMSFQDAAARASLLHFDYGDLTPWEKNVMRRLFFFYTFPSRNIPLQARQLVTRPGKYANLEKARQTSAEIAGLDPGWEQDTSQFEGRQLPFALRWKGKPYTVSLGQPFTDLNDIASVAEGVYAIPRLLSGAKADKDLLNLGITPWKRALEMLGPYKTIPEVIQNSSFYFHDDIAPKGNELTDAPEWAIQLAKHGGQNFSELLGIKHEGGTYKWDKRTPYLLRSLQPGLIGATGALMNAIPGVGTLGVKTGKDYRGRSEAQKLLGLTGLRAVDLNAKTARERRLYDRREALQTEMDQFRELYKDEHPGKDWKEDRRYKRMLRENRRLDDRIERVAPTEEQKAEQAPSDPRLQRLREIRGGRTIQRDDPRLERLQEIRQQRLGTR